MIKHDRPRCGEPTTGAWWFGRRVKICPVCLEMDRQWGDKPIEYEEVDDGEN